ncbi:DUF5723 family protein [Flavobacteriales bacterium]|nr:DUF5723 family protein [Flavobacteriales bacterium]
MRNLTLIISLFLVPFLLKSQEKFTIDLNSDLGIYNSSLDVRTLLNSFAYIDDEQKQAILNKLDAENFFYVDINNTIKMTHRKGLSLAFGNHVTSYGKYNRDIVRLALYGNTNFAGETFDLAPIEGKFFHYSDITIGYEFSEKFSSSVSLIAGHQFVSGEFKKLDFSTAEYGQSISYDLALEDAVESVHTRYIIDNRSDLAKFKGIGELFKSAGRGFSVGFDYNGEIYGGKYQLSLKDLGFIKWRDDGQTNRYDFAIDDLIVPLEVSDFSEIESSYFTAEIDTLRDLINPYSDSYVFFLPARLNGSFSKDIVGNEYVDSYTISLEHRFGMYSNARIAADFHKNINKHEFILGYHIGGLERNGLQFKYNYKGERMHFQLFTRHTSIFDLNSMYGLNIGVGLKFLIGSMKNDEENIENIEE